MRRPLLIVLCLCAVASVEAGQIVVSSQTTISTHSASLWDTVTISGTKVSSATGATITANVNYLYFKLDNDTIAFGTGNASLARGIFITADNIVIDGGYFIHSPTGTLANDAANPAWPTDTTIHDCAAIRISDQTGIEIKNVRRAVVKGWGSDNQSGGVIRGGNQFWVHDCDSLTNLYYAFNRRDYFEATVIRSSSGSSYIPSGVLMHDGTAWGAYNFKVTNNEIISKCHVGIYFANYPSSDTTLGARPICIIDSNMISNDSRNTKYTSYPAGTYAGTTQNYALQITDAGPGTKIRYNTIRSGSAYLGGQGIHLVGLRGSPANPVEVSHNDIDVHSAGNTEYGVGFLNLAIKWRQNCHDLWMHHNRIVYTIDTASIVPDYGHPYSPYGHAVEDQTEWGGGDIPPRNILFENNACSLKVRPNANYAGATLSGGAYNFAEGYLDDASQVIRYNNFYSEGSAVICNGQTGSDEGADYRRLYGDTLSRKVMNFSCQYTYELGVRGGSDIGMIATDVYYGANTSSTTEPSWSYRCGTGAVYPGDLTFRRTIHVKIVDYNVNQLPNATVTGVNSYGKTVLSGTTGVTGLVSAPVTYAWYSRTLTDSLSYNPLTVTVSRINRYGVTETRTKKVTVNATTDTVKFTLDNADFVELERNVANTATSDPQTGVPREQCGFKGGDTLWWYTSYEVTNLPGGGFGRAAGWGTGTITRLSTSGLLYNHAHFDYRHDTLWSFAKNSSSSGPFYVRLWNLNGPAMSQLGTGYTIPSDPQNLIGGGVHYQKVSAADSAKMVMYLRAGGTGPYTNNVMYWTSTNNGLNWTYGGTAYALGNDIRVDVDPQASGTGAWGVSYNYGGNDLLYSSVWNGTTWSSEAINSATFPMNQRTFATVQDTLGWKHVIWNTYTTPNYVLHAWKKPGALTWSIDTLDVWPRAIDAAEDLVKISATCNDGYNRVRFQYNKALDATVGNLAVYECKWSNYAEQASQPLRISSMAQTLALTGSLNVPKSVTRDYSMCMYTSGTASRPLWLNLVRDTTAGAGPITPEPIDTFLIIADASSNEGDSMTFIVTLSPALGTNISYTLFTSGGTALDCAIPPNGCGNVYKSRAEVRTIFAGSTTDRFKIATCRDNCVTGNLQYGMVLTAFSVPAVRNASSDTVAVGTVINIDANPPESQPGKKVFGVKKL